MTANDAPATSAEAIFLNIDVLCTVSSEKRGHAAAEQD
jgi:hypothetical protein